MIHVTVCAVVASRVKDAAEVRSPGDDEVKLVPVAGPGMSPRYFVQLLALELAVGNAEAMVAAEVQQSLTVFVQLANTEVAETDGPCLPVGFNACAEVA